MALRTFQIMGQAYAPVGSVSVTAIFDGVTVHNGVVPTTNGLTPDANTARDVMMQFDVQDTLYNNVVSSSFAATGGDFYIASVKANNSDPLDLAAFNYLWQRAAQAPSKINIKLDGVLLDTAEAYGWHYLVPDGSTLEIDWNLPGPGVNDELPGHATITADLCVVGKEYNIRTPGTTDFTLAGAANSLLGTVFVCTAAGTGTGTVMPTGK